MTAVSASAPGKIILFGEHAVVYGQPALAVPLHSLQATATVSPGQAGAGLIIRALDIDTTLSLAETAAHALAVAARLTLDRLGAPEPDAEIAIESTIPIASGLGSGAAVTAALVCALSEYLRAPLATPELSALVYEVEKLYHGTPSGVDNTVVCYGQPVYFVRGHEPEVFTPAAPFHLLVGDTGRPSPTRETVGAVRAGWQREPARYEAIFEEIGGLVREARAAIESGETTRLGPLMVQNQDLLRRLEVSSPELERLIDAALAAGALGAKLSGGGGGGNMIALVSAANADRVAQALSEAGAARVIQTTVS